MKKYIKDLKVGEKIAETFLLKKKEIKKTKDNKPYLALFLSDKSGLIEARMWDNAEYADSKVETGAPVFITGSVEKWKENMQFKVDDIRRASAEEFKMEDLIRAIENKEELFGKVKDFLKNIKNGWIKKLSEDILNDDEFIEKFKNAPGAQSWHNAYIGGLLEHTYEVMFIADKVCFLYPEADRDICIISAFMHDIGKVAEIDAKTFEQTVEGGLIGHLPLGFEMVSERIRKIEDFPENLAVQLKHNILSHHGEYEKQSPVLPKTLEATIVYQVDELVSQANAVKEVIGMQKAPQKIWSNYISIKNRKYFLLKPDEYQGKE